MQVQFWGTRGSIPKPGPTTIRYGGNTHCVEIRTNGGTLVIIDGGTGLHGLGLKLMSGGARGLTGHMLISHTHWDHIQGVPFFVPFFIPGNSWDIYGPKGLNQSLRETLAGQMQHTYFPVTPDQFGATLRYHDLLEGSFWIDDVKVTAQYLNHPALTLGYRLEADGAVLVYCCDHEPFLRAAAEGTAGLSGLDQKHAEFVAGADLLIHDAQYTAAEYPAKVGWGHSPMEFVVRLARQTGVREVALAHHDPLRTDDALDGLIEHLKAGSAADGCTLAISGATEGKLIDLKPSGVRPAPAGLAEVSAMAPVNPALTHRSVLICVANAKIAAALEQAVRAEGLRANICAGADEVRQLIARDPPSLAFLDPAANAAIGALRSMNDGQLPIVMVAEKEHDEPGVTECLVAPFTESFARAKIRAWVLREACRWMRARIPENEATRLAALHALGVLDTEREERFDRITRLAGALFNVPMSIITLVDDNRQWFKSCHGFEATESSRDLSFCAHIAHNSEPMIVSDTFTDDRFADHPQVISGPRIRFYAGYPLVLDDGHCIGTLCLADSRPRTFEQAELDRLGDLAGLARQQLQDFALKRA